MLIKDEYIILNEKSAQRDASTARWLPKIFAPPQTPFPGARDGQNLISWRWSLYFTYKPSLVRIDARSIEL